MSHDAALIRLKNLLQTAQVNDVEKLVAALFGALLDCNVFVSKSGFQFGADAGTATSEGINIRFECKRYSDGTALSERELLGEIDQALDRDPFLEAWVLVTTRNVNEQLASSLIRRGSKAGLPVVIVDWQSHEFSRLAALCTVDSTKVGEFISTEARHLVEEIAEAAKRFLERLKREIQSWCLGYANLQQASHQHLQRIWVDEVFSHGNTGQIMSGGTRGQLRIRREAPHAAFSSWWIQSDNPSPLAVVGREGIGKTWVCVDWLTENLDDLPIVLLVNASFTHGISEPTESDVVELIAGQLFRLIAVRNLEFWIERVKRYLARPVSDGPTILLYLDGLNERRSVKWARLVQIVYETDLCGRIRLFISTRPDHFQNDLRNGRICQPQMTRIEVLPFDKTDGGELDQLLGKHGLSRTDLSSQLIDICCNARLFSLVVRLRSSLNGVADVTVHRVLWEYGRDELSIRSDRAFSPTDWTEWLKQVAANYRSGSSLNSRLSIEDSVNRPSLERHEVYERLSGIIDGQFASSDEFGNVTLDPKLVEHALGLQLVAELSQYAGVIDRDEAEAVQTFLEPISGLDVFAEILRAAVNISICTTNVSESTRTILVNAWLQCQNFPDGHAEDVLSLSVPLCPSLLNLTEREHFHYQERAASLSLAALQLAIKSGGCTQQLIVERIVSWFKIIPLGLNSRRLANEQFEIRQRSEIELQIGTAVPGARSILGLDFELINDEIDSRIGVGIQLIQNIPLLVCKPIFERFAVIHSIVPQDRIFRQLDWLCLLNERDNRDTNSMLREIANDIVARPPEQGVHDQLPSKCASTLLWLSTEQADAEEAERNRPAIGRHWNYESDYLPDPFQSLFALERRHVSTVLTNASTQIFARLRRVQEFFVDPTIQYPEAFVAELARAASELDTTQVDSGIGQTESDYVFDICLPAIAAVTPPSLRMLVDKRLSEINGSDRRALYWRVMKSVRVFIAIDDSAISYQQLRTVCLSLDGQDRWLTESHLLFHELFSQHAFDQCSALLRCDLDGLLNDFAYVLREISSSEADRLVREFGDGNEEMRLRLLVLFSFAAVEISSEVINWMFREALDVHENIKNLAFLVLAKLAPAEFGERLWESNWKWQRAIPAYQSQYGSLALIHGTVSEPFDTVASRVTPSLLLYAIRLRGSQPADIAFGTSILQSILRTSPVLAESDLRFDVDVPQEQELTVNLRLDYGNELSDFSGILTDQMINSVNVRRRDANLRFREYILETQKKGGDLLLSPIDPRDIDDCLRVDLELAKNLLDGMDQQSSDFRKRVQRAELFFLALCESLLQSNPDIGCRLWKALREVLQSRYTGAAKVSELLHIIFRVSDSAQVDALRLELFDLCNCNTDKQLFEIALASQYNGLGRWLASQIEQDRSSQVAWKVRRSYVLEAFTIGNPVSLNEAWPCGPIDSELAELRHWSARRRVQEAFSRHWWREYVSAAHSVAAYRAWILFLDSSDRRAYLLTKDAHEAFAEKTELNRRKWAHLKLNKNNMDRAFEENEKKFEEQFLHRSIAKEISPWRRD